LIIGEYKCGGGDNVSTALMNVYALALTMTSISYATKLLISI